jgi:hypothetical protein
MKSIRWAAILCSVALTFASLPGCRSEPKEPATTAPGAVDADKLAAAKARYSAKGEMLVGEVAAANDRLAAVTGVDPKAVDKNKVFDFIDIDSNKVINNGTLTDVSAAGRLIIEYDQAGERPPRPGDLCVQLK